MKRPEKKEIIDCMCGYHCSVAKDEGHNQCWKEFNKYLPTEEEIIKLIDKCLDDDCMTETSQLAKIISERINK